MILEVYILESKAYESKLDSWVLVLQQVLDTKPEFWVKRDQILDILANYLLYKNQLNYKNFKILSNHKKNILNKWSWNFPIIKLSLLKKNKCFWPIYLPTKSKKTIKIRIAKIFTHTKKN